MHSIGIKFGLARGWKSLLPVSSWLICCQVVIGISAVGLNISFAAGSFPVHLLVILIFALSDSLRVLVILSLRSRSFFYRTGIFSREGNVTFVSLKLSFFVAEPRRICSYALGSNRINFIVRLLRCSSRRNLNVITSQSKISVRRTTKDIPLFEHD